MSKEVIIVLGMHRSYTSLLASWLHQNGVVMYDRAKLIVTDVLYEDPDILDLHVDILKAHGMNWLNARAPFTDPGDLFHMRAQRIWEQKSAQHDVWGWKEPRTCVLYRQFWSAFAKDAKLLFIYRHPMAVVESLHQREVHEKLARRRGLLRNGMFIRWWAQRHRRISDQVYLNCWNYYNRCCLNIAKAHDPQNVFVLKAEELVEEEINLRSIISGVWKIPLGSHSLKELYQPSSTAIESLSFQQYREDLVRETADILTQWEKLQAANPVAFNAMTG